MKNKHKIQKFKSGAINIPKQKSVSKNNNFLNNQKYIYGTREKKKVLATFLSQKNIQTIVSYLGLFDILFYFILGGIFICAMNGGPLSGHMIFVATVVLPIILWGSYVYFVFQGKIHFSKNEISNVKNYFLSDNNYGNIILWIIFLICTRVGLFIAFIFLGLGYIVFVIYALSTVYILEHIFKKHSIPFFLISLFRFNFKKIIFFPFIVILSIPILLISYFVTHLSKYQTYKLRPQGNMLGNFEKIGTLSWKNDFYEITKK